MAVLSTLAWVAGTGAASEPTSLSSLRLPVAALHGAVLYDQTSIDDNEGVQVDDLGGLGPASEASDDFEVGAAGWSVTGISLNAFGRDATGHTVAPPSTLRVSVHADLNGTPSPNAVCSYERLLGHFSGAPRYQVDASFPGACVLTQGHYWMKATFLRSDARVPSGFWIENASVHGVPALARTAQRSGCADWATPAACGQSSLAANDLSFRILGTTAPTQVAGCATEGICLRVTVAPDNGNPAQCGTQTELAVTRGTAVNYCYWVTNHSSTTLAYHSLIDTVSGQLLDLQHQSIPPGVTWQYNRIGIPSATEQPTATWTAWDALPGYDHVQATAELVEVATTGTPVYLDALNGAALQMPFSFSLYGHTSNSLCVVKDGFALFDAPSCYGCFDGGCTIMGLPISNLDTPAVFAWWALLGSHGVVYYDTVGTAPNRRFVLEWSQLDHFYETRGNGYVTFEAIFAEASNTLSFQYLNTAFDQPDHPEWDGTGTFGLQLSSQLYDVQASPVSSNSSITWTPRPVDTYSASTQVTVTVGEPIATATPSELSAAVAQGGGATSALVIANAGDYPMQWSLASAPANDRSHFPLVAAQIAHRVDSNARVPLQAPLAFVPPSTDRPDEHTHSSLGSMPTPAFGQSLANGLYYLHFPDLADPANAEQLSPFSHIPIYAGDFIDNDFSKEYVVDINNRLLTSSTSDGSLEPIAQLSDSSLPDAWPSIRWDPTTGTLYGVFYDENSATHLYTIDRSSGFIERVGDFPVDMTILTLAIDSEGHMFGIDIASASLVAIDKTTADAQTIGALGFAANYLQSMDFDDASGTLYLAGFDAASMRGGLYTVDTVLGGAQLVGSFPDGEQVAAFAVASPTPGCASGTPPWMSFAPSSGQLDPGASVDVEVFFDASDLLVGRYDAEACVRYNGRLADRVSVPVQLIVSPATGDTIFDDGFDTGGAR